MPLYAHPIDGVVFETFDTEQPISDYFPDPEGWVACPDATQQGWTVSETNGVWTFAEPPAPPVPDTRIAAQVALDKSDMTILRCYEHGVTVPRLGRVSCHAPGLAARLCNQPAAVNARALSGRCRCRQGI